MEQDLEELRDQIAESANEATQYARDSTIRDLVQLAQAEQLQGIRKALEGIKNVLEKTLYEKLEETMSEYIPDVNIRSQERNERDDD